MNTAEDRHLAERFVRDHYSGGTLSPDAQAVAACVRGYLADHDETPISDAALEAAGMKSDHDRDAGEIKYYAGHLLREHLVIYLNPDPEEDEEVVSGASISDGDVSEHLPAGLLPRTVGQLRQLCEGLGLPFAGR